VQLFVVACSVSCVWNGHLVVSCLWRGAWLVNILELPKVINCTYSALCSALVPQAKCTGFLPLPNAGRSGKGIGIRELATKMASPLIPSGDCLGSFFLKLMGNLGIYLLIHCHKSMSFKFYWVSNILSRKNTINGEIHCWYNQKFYV
jgi:hypothetical protein